MPNMPASMSLKAMLSLIQPPISLRISSSLDSPLPRLAPSLLPSPSREVPSESKPALALSNIPLRASEKPSGSFNASAKALAKFLILFTTASITRPTALRPATPASTPLNSAVKPFLTVSCALAESSRDFVKFLKPVAALVSPSSRIFVKSVPPKTSEKASLTGLMKLCAETPS